MLSYPNSTLLSQSSDPELYLLLSSQLIYQISVRNLFDLPQRSLNSLQIHFSIVISAWAKGAIWNTSDSPNPVGKLMKKQTFWAVWAVQKTVFPLQKLGKCKRCAQSTRNLPFWITFHTFHTSRDVVHPLSIVEIDKWLWRHEHDLAQSISDGRRGGG